MYPDTSGENVTSQHCRMSDFALLSLQGCKIQIPCDIAVLDRKGRIRMTLFEELGIEYKECDGLFYPVLSVENEVAMPYAGKYGDMWIQYMKENYPERYGNLVRLGRIYEKATEINEEAYELLDGIEERYLKKHMSSNSFVEMYRLRVQVRMMAEEAVLEQLVRQYH